MTCSGVSFFKPIFGRGSLLYAFHQSHFSSGHSHLHLPICVRPLVRKHLYLDRQKRHGSHHRDPAAARGCCGKRDEQPARTPGLGPPIQPQPSQSVWKWNLQQAEQQARQAQEQLEAARQKAAEAEREAQQTIQQSKEYIDSHDNNQYMRRAFRYKLRMAAEAAQAAQAKAQEAADQVKQAEQRVADALQQVQGAREDAALYNPSK